MEPGNGKLNSTEWCLNQNDCLIIPNIQFYGLQIPFLNLLAHITARLSPVPRSVDAMLRCTRYITRKKNRELEERDLFMNINFFFRRKVQSNQNIIRSFMPPYPLWLMSSSNGRLNGDSPNLAWTDKMLLSKNEFDFPFQQIDNASSRSNWADLFFDIFG